MMQTGIFSSLRARRVVSTEIGLEIPDLADGIPIEIVIRHSLQRCLQFLLPRNLGRILALARNGDTQRRLAPFEHGAVALGLAALDKFLPRLALRPLERGEIGAGVRQAQRNHTLRMSTSASSSAGGPPAEVPTMIALLDLKMIEQPERIARKRCERVVLSV